MNHFPTTEQYSVYVFDGILARSLDIVHILILILACNVSQKSSCCSFIHHYYFVLLYYFFSIGTRTRTFVSEFLITDLAYIYMPTTNH
jgi:hypothetical protein